MLRESSTIAVLLTNRRVEVFRRKEQRNELQRAGDLEIILARWVGWIARTWDEEDVRQGKKKQML